MDYPKNGWGLLDRGMQSATSGRQDPYFGRGTMQVRFSKAGCLWSIILSVVLTILLNLALRACAVSTNRPASFEEFGANHPGQSPAYMQGSG